MAAVQPHVAPRRHHPPPPPPSPQPPAPALSPSLAIVARPQLRCKRSHAADVARSRKEGVAGSCFPCPSEPLLIDLDSGSDDEEDGCGSCVDGGERGEGQDDDEQGSGSVAAWWSQESSLRRCFLLAKRSRTAEDDRAGGEDPKVAAVRRQEEDRKFWEACLASGYP
ncbi:uncharacterized protein LOC133912514 [Phragmites australis]|uniref:uncharacterized protein LOC133912514 n=1 Tax=Phragmites australis TaxID=29695 RepID=UPI002D794892|nr:uncharacterized protein LOC133912514 [Phragmites australis]